MKRNWYSVAAIALIVSGLLLGGASSQGLLGNAFLQAFAAVMLGWTYARSTDAAHAQAVSIRVPTLALCVVAAAQFVPLPPSIWSHLPGRETVAHGFGMLDRPLPWLTLSLSPWDSLASVLGWLPMIAVFFVVREPRGPSFSQLVLIVTAVAVSSTSLGIVQLSTGGGYPYTITNYGLPVGFFANVNHQASFLIAAFVLWTGLFARSEAARGERGAIRLGPTVYFGVSAFLAIGVVLSGSLAGYLLLGLANVGAALILRPQWRPSTMLMGVGLAGGAVTLAFAAQLNSVWSLLPVDTEVKGVGRVDIWAQSLRAAWAFFPFGSGLGTFETIYHWFESPAEVTTTFVNHAHNDLLEVAVETGVIGLGACLAVAVWVVRRLHAGLSGHSVISDTAGLVAIVFAFHSLVDYPLRTAACSMTLAIALGLLARDPARTSHSAGRGAPDTGVVRGRRRS